MNDQTAKHDAGTRRLTMAEYIDRYELLNQFLDTKPYKLSGQFEKLICNIPAADVAPVKHGGWRHIGGDEWCCSCCSFVITTEGGWEVPTKKYCEECGAKMDLEG